MKPFLRVIFAFLIVFSIFFVVGCNRNNSTTTTNETTVTTTKKDTIEGETHIIESNFIKNEDKVVSASELVIYDGPSYLTPYDKLSVKVEDKELFVYETRVNHDTQFSWTTPKDTTGVVIFDFAGEVNVEVDVKETVTSAKVTPEIYGVSPRIEGTKIYFKLQYPTSYVLEYNDSSDNALHIFANEIESSEEKVTEEMAAQDDSIIYLAPGVYKADAIPLESNMTLYIAGGAFVYGQIRTEGLENIKIKGRGILSGSLYNRRSESEYTLPIELRTSSNITIQDITILDPAGWAITLYKSNNININNIHIITARQNGDGISVQSCSDVNVNGGFVRTWDDSLVVKNVDGGLTSNITFDGVTVWTDLAQSMEVGYEANGTTMTDITFKNIIVLHNFHKAVISMHNADDSQISNVTYKDIYIEDAQTLGDNRTDLENDFLIDFCVLYNTDWSKSVDIKGTVRNVLVENVVVKRIAESVVSRINGYSNTSNISGVTIKNILIQDKKMEFASDLGLLTNQYTSNVSVSYDKDPVGAIIKLPYLLSLTNSEVEVKETTNIVQEGMLVPEFARGSGELSYIGVKDKVNATVSATHSKGNKNTTPSDDGSGDFSASGYNPSSAYDNDKTTTWKSKEWMNEDEEFACLTFDFGGTAVNVGVVRIIGNVDNDFFYTYSIQIWGLKLKSDGSINDKYTKLVSLKDYHMSPGSNNAIDINITTQQYAGLQLRLYRGDQDTSSKYYEIAEVEFYAPSLAYNKAIVDSSEHNDVYNVEKLVDGDATGTSYYESKEVPAYVVIDLGDVYDISTIVFSLPPSLLWNARTEEIEILVSDSELAYSSESTAFTTIVNKKAYLFDPATGNRNIVNFEEVSARYVKVIIYSNDIAGGYAAQLSEISIYGN